MAEAKSAGEAYDPIKPPRPATVQLGLPATVQGLINWLSTLNPERKLLRCDLQLEKEK